MTAFVSASRLAASRSIRSSRLAASRSIRSSRLAASRSIRSSRLAASRSIRSSRLVASIRSNRISNSRLGAARRAAQMLTISAVSATNVAATVAALPIHCGISLLPYIHPAPRRAGLRQVEEPLAVPDPADAQAVMQPDQSDPPSEAFGPVQTLGGGMAPVPGNRIPAKAGSLTDPNRLRRGSRTAVAEPSLAPQGDDAGSSRCRTGLDEEIISARRPSPTTSGRPWCQVAASNRGGCPSNLSDSSSTPASSAASNVGPCAASRTRGRGRGSRG